MEWARYIYIHNVYVYACIYMYIYICLFIYAFDDTVGCTPFSCWKEIRIYCEIQHVYGV